MPKKPRAMDPASSDDDETGSDSDDAQAFTHQFMSHMSNTQMDLKKSTKSKKSTMSKKSTKSKKSTLSKKSTGKLSKNDSEHSDTSDSDSDDDNFVEQRLSSSEEEEQNTSNIHKSDHISRTMKGRDAVKKVSSSPGEEIGTDSDEAMSADVLSDSDDNHSDDSDDPDDDSEQTNDDQSDDLEVDSGAESDSERKHITRESQLQKPGSKTIAETKVKKTVKQELAELRNELADLPFEKLQKLKEKIGVKAYNETMFGRAKKSSDTPPDYKRVNKNRPMEVSSKKPVSRYQDVFQVKKKVHRDPRFDDLSGKYDETIFNSTYSFLGDLKEREKKKLVRAYQREKDPDKKKQLEEHLKRMNQQEKSQREREIKRQRQINRKKQEADLVKQGKKPFFLKKADEKKLELAEKFKELKKSGKVENYLAKRRKKTASKDRKHLPKNNAV